MFEFISMCGLVAIYNRQLLLTAAGPAVRLIAENRARGTLDRTRADVKSSRGSQRMVSRRRLLAAMLLGVLLPAVGTAQTRFGNISGSVRDTTGAVLPGVVVEVASAVLIERTRTATTDDQGRYQVVDLPPGTYAVTFTLVGFTTIKREGIELTVGFTAPVNAELRLGGIEETIVVTGASPMVDTQNVRSQNVLSHEVLETIPTGKSIPAYVALTLGATGGLASQDVGGNRGDLN